ncbi:MAG: hypothetical protein GF313_15860 [Caldithrix sp.]|nr:hypothetical protein [Caldithrix sp.]
MSTLKIILMLMILFVSVRCASVADQNLASEDTNPAFDISEQISTLILKHVHHLPNRRVAVADFTDINGDELEEGKILAEQVITHLAGDSNLAVIERSQLHKVLDEQKLTLSGITEEEQQAGQILNVDAIISGSIAHLQNEEEISVRMIDVNTGEIYCAEHYQRNAQQREKALAALPDRQRQKIQKEFKTREAMRQSDPQLYKLLQKHKAELAELKQKNPQNFNRILRTLKTVKQLKEKNPRLFLLVTAPNRPNNTRRIRDRKTQEFRKFNELRQQIEFIASHSPAYREIIRIQRTNVQKDLRRE